MRDSPGAQACRAVRVQGAKTRSLRMDLALDTLRRPTASTTNPALNKAQVDGFVACTNTRLSNCRLLFPVPTPMSFDGMRVIEAEASFIDEVGRWLEKQHAFPAVDDTESRMLALKHWIDRGWARRASGRRSSGR